jgi:hypothetical protein
MLPIREDILALDEPPLTREVSFWPGIGIAARLLKRWRASQRGKKEARLSELLSAPSRCRTRAELETLLGQPKYALTGNCGGTSRQGEAIEHPDRIEVYEVDNCTIQLWFFLEERRVMALGSVSATSMDLWEAIQEQRASGKWH